MNKILWVSHLFENSGWGECARNHVFAHKDYFDLTCRSVDFHPGFESKELAQMCEKSMEKVTHVIQYILPHTYERFPGVKNIGFVELESLDIKYSTWPDHMEKMDEIWVTSETNASTLRASGVKRPIKLFNHPLNLSVDRSQLGKIGVRYLDGNFVFYTVAEHNARKNLEQLIKCFHLAFDASEPVRLLIKTNANINQMCADIKTHLGLYKKKEDYIQEAIISQRIPQDDMWALHNAGNCFITTSAGESWQQPLADAAIIGNRTIGSTMLSMQEFISDEFYTSGTARCIGSTQFSGYQNGHDVWGMYSDDDIIESMRNVFDNRAKKFEKLDLDKFSVEKTNERLKELLECK